MNGTMAHFLTTPYMSIYYNAGSEDPLASAAAAGEDRRRNRSLCASSFVYFLLFNVGVKVNTAKRKIPTARCY